MDRRSFIKMVGATAIIPALPIPEAKKVMVGIDLARGDSYTEARLTPYQQQMYDRIKRGDNVVVLWPKGAGKTFFYNKVKKDLSKIPHRDIFNIF